MTTASLPVRLETAAAIIASMGDAPYPSLVSGYGHHGAVEVAWYLSTRYETDEEQKTAALAVLRAAGGSWDKSTSQPDTMAYEQLRDGVRLHVQVSREAVCERVVVGTHEVTTPAIPAQPERPAQTTTVEDVEWRCLPILAEVTS